MAKKVVVCPVCQGKGKDDNFFACLCLGCKGKGTIEVDK